MIARALLGVVLAGAAATAGPVLSREIALAAAPPVVGLDHIPVAVDDLDRAADRYRELGFVLKSGRTHENGIRNEHAKFRDGTEIELITARDARDPLTAAYRDHLAAGDGPAFVAFYAQNMAAVARRLDAARTPFRREGGLLSFPDEAALRYIFFGPRNHSPTDLPEHYAHPNGAESLIGVWIAGDDAGAERKLLGIAGATFADENVFVPGPARALVARFPEAEVVFLPGARQSIPGRRIVGAVLRTRDLEALRRVLAGTSLKAPPIVRTAAGRSAFVPPAIAHGLWLEFREQPR